MKIYEIPACKNVFSESGAIISSFHLMNNQDNNWAYSLDYPEEYNQVIDFFEEHIAIGC